VLMTQKPTMFGLQYRMAQEALPSFYPFIRSRIVELSLSDLKVVLCEGDPYLSKLSIEAQDRFRPLEPGPCVLVSKDTTIGSKLSELVCSANRGQSSVKVLMKDAEKKLLINLFVDKADLPSNEALNIEEELAEKEVVEDEKD